MSTLSPEEQELFNVTKNALPRFLYQKDDAPQETFGAAAKLFKLAKDQIASWWTNSFIAQATGFWLDQHAIDRGTRRQVGESDAALSTRIRQVDDAVTVPALTSKSTAIVPGAHLIELRQVAAHFGQRAGRLKCPAPSLITNGSSITFTDGASVTYTVKFWVSGTAPSGGTHIYVVDIRTAAVPADVASAFITTVGAGSFTGVSLASIGTGDGESVYFVGTGTSVAKVTAVVTGTAFVWTIPSSNNCAVGRGCRVAAKATGPAANEIIVILPYGTDTATGQGVSDMLRQFKPAAFPTQVEIRRIP